MSISQQTRQQVSFFEFDSRVSRLAQPGLVATQYILRRGNVYPLPKHTSAYFTASHRLSTRQDSRVDENVRGDLVIQDACLACHRQIAIDAVFTSEDCSTVLGLHSSCRRDPASMPLNSADPILGPHECHGKGKLADCEAKRHW